MIPKGFPCEIPDGRKYYIETSRGDDYSPVAMPRFSGGRGLLRGVSWLVLLCMVELAAAMPVLAVDSIGDEGVSIGAVAGDVGTALPPVAPSTANPGIDDLSGPAAAVPFQLAKPAVRRVGCSAAPPLSLLSHAPALVGERGPPSSR